MVRIHGHDKSRLLLYIGILSSSAATDLYSSADRKNSTENFLLRLIAAWKNGTR